MSSVPAERSHDIARRALQRLSLAGALRTVDTAFADLLQRLGAGPEVALAGALAMRAVAQGDSGVALTRVDALLATLDTSATLPDADVWREALRTSPLVALSAAREIGFTGDHGVATVTRSDGGGRKPPAALLVFEHDRVALLRYARFEHDLACRLLARNAAGEDHEAFEAEFGMAEFGTPTTAEFGTAEFGTPTFPKREELGAEFGTPTVLNDDETTAFGKTELGREELGAPTFPKREELGTPIFPAESSGQFGTPTVLNPEEGKRPHLPSLHPRTLDLLQKLFAPASGQAQPRAGTGPDRQALAALLALRRHLLLLTGGPGTGKTTTVARLLALAVEDARVQGRALPRIALAAPTGRAAARLAEAVAAQLARDLADGRLDAAQAAAVPRQAATLHRLLGVRPGELDFRHHARHPLAFDLVVVDEASMIDLPLMTRLVAAVAPQARLVLIGDPDQLPAVEAGDVLGALCSAAGDGLAIAVEDAQVASAALGTQVPALAAQTDPPLPLAGARVQLVHGWRQAGAAPLQAFAAAVRAGDADGALALLRAASSAHADGIDTEASLLHRHGEPAALAAWLRATALPVFAAVRDADSAEAALAHAQRLRLLTALRRGPYGAETWNAWCAAELGARGRWFHGALIAITANSRHHGLYNGDLGVIRRDPDGSLKAWFALHDPDGGTRWRGWRPAQLPAHDLAFATTVHKAQGSEFERVALILPDRESRALGRELLYTAATRARRALWLWAAPERLREAIDRPVLRDSGLLARLRAGR